MYVYSYKFVLIGSSKTSCLVKYVCSVYEAPVCTKHLSVRSACLYEAPVCTKHLSVRSTCLYEAPVCVVYL